jgi:hypothetical protein
MSPNSVKVPNMKSTFLSLLCKICATPIRKIGRKYIVNSWGWLDNAITFGLENVKRKLEKIAIKNSTLKYLVNKKYNEK